MIVTFNERDIQIQTCPTTGVDRSTGSEGSKSLAAVVNLRSDCRLALERLRTKATVISSLGRHGGGPGSELTEPTRQIRLTGKI